MGTGYGLSSLSPPLWVLWFQLRTLDSPLSVSSWLISSLTWGGRTRRQGADQRIRAVLAYAGLHSSLHLSGLTFHPVLGDPLLSHPCHQLCLGEIPEQRRPCQKEVAQGLDFPLGHREGRAALWVQPGAPWKPTAGSQVRERTAEPG